MEKSVCAETLSEIQSNKRSIYALVFCRLLQPSAVVPEIIKT